MYKKYSFCFIFLACFLEHLTPGGSTSISKIHPALLGHPAASSSPHVAGISKHSFAPRFDVRALLKETYGDKSLARRKRSPSPKFHNPKEITFKDLEKWLEPVTSAGPTKLKKHLGNAFRSNLYRRRKRYPYNYIPVKKPQRLGGPKPFLEEEDVLPYLDYATSPSGSKPGLIKALGNVFTPFNYLDHGGSYNIFEKLFGTIKKGLRAIKAFVRDILRQIFHVVSYPLRAIGLLNQNRRPAYLPYGIRKKRASHTKETDEEQAARVRKLEIEIEYLGKKYDIMREYADSLTAMKESLQSVHKFS